MKKWKIWKATDDERLLSESGKIYRIGFWVLSAGILLDVLIKLALYLPGSRQSWGLFPLVGMEGIVLVAALVLSALLAAGRGILTMGADPEADHFPARHYALVSLGVGLGLSAAGLGLRAAFYPHWEFDAGALVLVFGLIILVVTVLTFLICFSAFYLLFRVARWRRRRWQGTEDKGEER